MKKIVKIIAIIHVVALILLAFLIPSGAIALLVKICGGNLTWMGACIPFFISLGILPFLIASKILVDLTKGG